MGWLSGYGDERWGMGGVGRNGQRANIWFVDSALLLKLTGFVILHLTPVGFFFIKNGSLQLIFFIILKYWISEYGRKNNGSPKVSISQCLEPVNMLSYMAKGTLQMRLKLKTRRWRDYHGLP